MENKMIKPNDSIIRSVTPKPLFAISRKCALIFGIVFAVMVVLAIQYVLQKNRAHEARAREALEGFGEDRSVDSPAPINPVGAF